MPETDPSSTPLAAGDPPAVGTLSVMHTADPFEAITPLLAIAKQKRAALATARTDLTTALANLDAAKIACERARLAEMAAYHAEQDAFDAIEDALTGIVEGDAPIATIGPNDPPEKGGG